MEKITLLPASALFFEIPGSRCVTADLDRPVLYSSGGRTVEWIFTEHLEAHEC